MSTVFGQEGRNLYNVFFIPDAAKRRAALDEWIKSTTPIIQAAVTQELDDLVEFITKDRWTEDGWRRGEAKLHIPLHCYESGGVTGSDLLTKRSH